MNKFDKIQKYFVKEIGRTSFYQVNHNDFLDFAIKIRFDYSFVVIKNLIYEKTANLKLIYIFENLEENILINLTLNFDQNEKINSLKKIYPASLWLESKIIKNHGEIFLEATDSIFNYSNLDKENIKFKEIETDDYLVNNVDYLLKHFVLNEKIVRNEVYFDKEANYLDKLIIGSTINEAEKFLEQYFSENFFHVKYLIVKNIEESLKIDIPYKAKFLRTIFLELGRVNHHLHLLSKFLGKVATNDYTHFIEKIRYEILKFNFKFCINDSFVFGGVNRDINVEFITDLRNLMIFLKEKVAELDFLVDKNRSLIEELKFSKINANSILDYGISGTLARASGLNIDQRKMNPYLCYGDIEFDIPVGINGDIFDRFIINFEEINQSIKIINQLTTNLPIGELKSVDSQKMDLLDISFSHFTNFEAPSGDMGLYLKLENGKIENFSFSFPSFFNFQGLMNFSIGAEFQKFSLFMESMRIDIKEIY